jgi:prohibitin 1
MKRRGSVDPLAVVGVLAAVVVVILFLAWACCWVTVDKGEVGVVTTFGEVSNDKLESGWHLVAPWKKVHHMEVVTQKDEEPESVPTSNGLAVQMRATLLFHLDPAHAPQMAREVGTKDYAGRVVTPYFKQAVRDVTAGFLPEALYTSERQAVEAKVLERVRKDLEPRGIVVEAVMLLDPILPQVVQERVQAKVAAEQDAIRMQSVFKQREQEALANKRQKELEAEAKVIEAKGIAEAQTIIKKDLDHSYLVYLWIEALKESAKHNNATIYIPTGGDGMPLFKDVGSGPAKK